MFFTKMPSVVIRMALTRILMLPLLSVDSIIEYLILGYYCVGGHSNLREFLLHQESQISVEEYEILFGRCCIARRVFYLR